MKNFIYTTLLLLLSSISVYAQNDVVRSNPVGNNPANTSTYNKQAIIDNNLKVRLNLSIPRGTSFTLNNARDTAGYIMYNTTIGRMGIYKGSGVWDTISTSGTSSLLNYYTKTQSDARFVPLTSTININGTTQDLSISRTWNVGTVTSLGVTPGTGISVSGSPVTSSGNITVTNTLPDQTVVLNAGTGISTSGTYPNFTITNTSPSSGGTVTSVATNTGSGITGGTITSSGTIAADTTILQTRYDKIVYVQHYGTTEAAIQSAINAASSDGKRGLVILEPGRVYTQINGLINGSISGNGAVDIQGNGATLRRGNQSTATTTVSANQASTTLTVDSVPSDWVVGNTLQIYDGNSVGNVNISGGSNNNIVSIVGNTITLAGAVGVNANTGGAYTWNIGSTVRKYYNQITTRRITTDAPIYQVTIDNLIFDGNYANNTGNYYWGVNRTIENASKINVTVSNCKFFDIPNECIYGGGFTILNNRATNINGSFFHIGASYNDHDFEWFYGEISGNVTYNTGIKYAESGHSEGVITFSATSGRYNINSNFFFNGAHHVIGNFQVGVATSDGSTRDFIFTNNYVKNFNTVFGTFSYTTPPFTTLNAGKFAVYDNVFDSCGVETLDATIADYDTLYIANNRLWGGTQINGIPNKAKEINDVYLPSYTPITTTINGKALSSNIVLGLASSDFANQGTTSTVLHGNASGNPSFGPISLTNDVSGVLTGTNGGTGVNNGSKTITVSGNTTIGTSTNTVEIATSGNTSITLPTSGTLATLAGSESLTNKKLGSLTTNGLVTTSGGDGTLSVTQISEGDWTGTASSETNCTVFEIRPMHWQRIGNRVHFSGFITINPVSTSSDFSFALTPPVASSFANFYDASGVMVAQQTGQPAAIGRVQCSTGTGNLFFVGTNTGGGTNMFISYSGMYKVIP